MGRACCYKGAAALESIPGHRNGKGRTVGQSAAYFHFVADYQPFDGVVVHTVPVLDGPVVQVVVLPQQVPAQVVQTLTQSQNSVRSSSSSARRASRFLVAS